MKVYRVYKSQYKKIHLHIVGHVNAQDGVTPYLFIADRKGEDADSMEGPTLHWFMRKLADHLGYDVKKRKRGKG